MIITIFGLTVLEIRSIAYNATLHKQFFSAGIIKAECLTLEQILKNFAIPKKDHLGMNVH